MSDWAWYMWLDSEVESYDYDPEYYDDDVRENDCNA